MATGYYKADGTTLYYSGKSFDGATSSTSFPSTSKYTTVKPYDDNLWLNPYSVSIYIQDGGNFDLSGIQYTDNRTLTVYNTSNFKGSCTNIMPNEAGVDNSPLTLEINGSIYPGQLQDIGQTTLINTYIREIKCVTSSSYVSISVNFDKWILPRLNILTIGGYLYEGTTSSSGVNWYSYGISEIHGSITCSSLTRLLLYPTVKFDLDLGYTPQLWIVYLSGVLNKDFVNNLIKDKNLVYLYANGVHWEDITLDCTFDGTYYKKASSTAHLSGPILLLYNFTTIRSSNLNNIDWKMVVIGVDNLVGGNGSTFSSNITSVKSLLVDRDGVEGPFTYIEASEYYDVDIKPLWTYVDLYEFSIPNAYPNIPGRIELNYPKRQYAKGETVTATYWGCKSDLDYWIQQYEDGTWHKIGSANPLTFTIQKNATIAAIPKYDDYIPEKLSVNLSSFPSTAGTVTGAGTYLAGSDVTISAAGTGNYVFQYWQELIGTTWVTYATSATITLEGIGRNRTLRAYFVELTDENKATLTVNATTGGTAGRSGDYVKGQSVTVNAIVDSGYTFKGWYLVGKTVETLVSTKTSYTFKISGDTTLNAVFVKKAYPGQDGGGIDSKPGGGDGTFDDSSDNPNDEINPPTMVDALLTIYSPTEAQITELGQYLYSDSAKGLAKNLLDYFGSLGTADLTAYIINTYQLPITVPTSGTKQVECGWYPTTVSMNVASGTAIEVGMGTCEVPAYYGNALDYKSRIQIYLPYVGFQDLDPAEVIGKTLGLKYFVDLITGDCVAKIYINDVIYYQFKGAMASPIPLGKDNFTDMIQQGINIGTGAITAGMAVSGAAGAISQGTAMHNFAIEQANAGTIYPEQFTASQQLIEEGTSRVPQAQMSLEQLQNKLSTAINTGTNVPHGTNAGGNMGWYMNQTPYIIIVRPNLSMPENYGHYHGYPSNITSKIGDLSGYTEFSAIHLEGLTATSNELAELEKILKGGIRIEN